MSEDIRKMIDKVRNYDEKYDPKDIYDYINKMHRSGWEKRKFDDIEWVLNHEYFLLKDISLDDPTVKWNCGQHPPIVINYSKLDTEIPPIVIDSHGYIIDGTHRVGAAKTKGHKTIKSFIGH